MKCKHQAVKKKQTKKHLYPKPVPSIEDKKKPNGISISQSKLKKTTTSEKLKVITRKD
jgi:hypothetical protein